MKHDKTIAKQLLILQKIADAAEDLLKSMDGDNWHNEATDRVEWLDHLINKYKSLVE